MCGASAVEGSYGLRLLLTGQRGYGATAARLTPDQKVGSSNLSALILNALPFFASHSASPLQAASIDSGQQVDPD